MSISKQTKDEIQEPLTGNKSRSKMIMKYCRVPRIAPPLAGGYCSCSSSITKCYWVLKCLSALLPGTGSAVFANIIVYVLNLIVCIQCSVVSGSSSLTLPVSCSCGRTCDFDCVQIVAVSMHPARIPKEFLDCLDYIWRMFYIEATTRFSLQELARSFRLGVTASAFFAQWFLTHEFQLIFHFPARRQNLEYNGSQLQRQFLRKIIYDYHRDVGTDVVRSNTELVVAGSFPGDLPHANDIDVFFQSDAQWHRLSLLYEEMVLQPLGLISDTREHRWYDGRRSPPSAVHQQPYHLNDVVHVFPTVLDWYLERHSNLSEELRRTLSSTIDHLPERLENGKYKVVRTRCTAPLSTDRHRKPFALKAINFVQVEACTAFRVGTFAKLVINSFDLHHCRTHLTVTDEGVYHCHADEVAKTCLRQRRLSLTTTAFQGSNQQEAVVVQLCRIHKKCLTGFHW